MDSLSVLRSNLGRAVPFLRLRAGWRQADLAARAETSRPVISRVERGHVETTTIETLHRVATALGASLHVELRWQGEQLDRLLDAAHASLQELSVRLLRDGGWLKAAEVSFNWYGDRGRVDAVGLHAATGTMLIIEVKVRIGDIQDTLGRLDVKTRLGRQVAKQLGWPVPKRVVPCLVVAETRSAHRLIAEHSELFARFSLRGRSARRWLAAPTKETVAGVLLFEPLPNAHRVSANRRVRCRKVSDAHGG